MNQNIVVKSIVDLAALVTLVPPLVHDAAVAQVAQEAEVPVQPKQEEGPEDAGEDKE